MNLVTLLSRLVGKDDVVAKSRKIASCETLARYGQGYSAKLVQGITYRDGSHGIVRTSLNPLGRAK